MMQQCNEPTCSGGSKQLISEAWMLHAMWTSSTWVLRGTCRAFSLFLTSRRICWAISNPPIGSICCAICESCERPETSLLHHSNDWTFDRQISARDYLVERFVELSIQLCALSWILLSLTCTIEDSICIPFKRFFFCAYAGCDLRFITQFLQMLLRDCLRFRFLRESEGNFLLSEGSFIKMFQKGFLAVPGVSLIS